MCTIFAHRLNRVRPDDARLFVAYSLHVLGIPLYLVTIATLAVLLSLCWSAASLYPQQHDAMSVQLDTIFYIIVGAAVLICVYVAAIIQYRTHRHCHSHIAVTPPETEAMMRAPLGFTEDQFTPSELPRTQLAVASLVRWLSEVGVPQDSIARFGREGFGSIVSLLCLSQHPTALAELAVPAEVQPRVAKALEFYSWLRNVARGIEGMHIGEVDALFVLMTGKLKDDLSLHTVKLMPRSAVGLLLEGAMPLRRQLELMVEFDILRGVHPPGALKLLSMGVLYYNTVTQVVDNFHVNERMVTEWTSTGVVAALATCMTVMVYAKPLFPEDESDERRWWMGLIFGLSTVMCLLSAILFTIFYIAFNQASPACGRACS